MSNNKNHTYIVKIFWKYKFLEPTAPPGPGPNSESRYHISLILINVFSRNKWMSDPMLLQWDPRDMPKLIVYFMT